MPTATDAPIRAEYAATEITDHVLDLYAQHADSARALASRLLYDRSEAEDVVQDVFLTLWRQPTCFDPARGTSRAWLLTVVRNRSLDHLRRRVPREDVADLADRLADPYSRDALEELESATLRDWLWRVVDDALPREQACLIRLAYQTGQTQQELAAATGLPLGTVKSRIRLGLDKLRCALRKDMLNPLS